MMSGNDLYSTSHFQSKLCQARQRSNSKSAVIPVSLPVTLLVTAFVELDILLGIGYRHHNPRIIIQTFNHRFSAYITHHCSYPAAIEVYFPIKEGANHHKITQ